jgi:RNA methyltransferase, TrmH family
MLVKSQVKYIQSLSQKKARDEEKLFVAEGPKIINELLAATNTSAVQIYAVENWISEQHELLTNVETDIIHMVSDAELERISFQPSPNQVLGLFKKPVFPNLNSLNGSISLVLDGIQDPGNLGTIIRSADWFGINRIFASEDSADAFNPKVVQSTMASITRVNLIYRDIGELIKTANVPVFAAVLEGKNLSELPKIKEGLIVIGNESKGIRHSILSGNYQPITIPKKGKAESLNAAVATGIILSHLT